MLARVEEQVKAMVNDQLRAAGFDPSLTAADLTTINGTEREVTYASAAAVPASSLSTTLSSRKGDQENKKEVRFWECRRALRLWPVKGASRESLNDFLTEKLRLDEEFVREDMGQVSIRRHVDGKNKKTDAVCVVFKTKQIRDQVKAHGSNLANFPDAGMRCHLPDFLQKDFHSLMPMAYDLKQKNPDLRRNVKFDEANLGLFMDVQVRKEGQWKRITPDQAKLAAKPRREGPEKMTTDELKGLVEEGSE